MMQVGTRVQVKAPGSSNAWFVAVVREVAHDGTAVAVLSETEECTLRKDEHDVAWRAHGDAMRAPPPSFPSCLPLGTSSRRAGSIVTMPFERMRARWPEWVPVVSYVSHTVDDETRTILGGGSLPTMNADLSSGRRTVGVYARKDAKRSMVAYVLSWKRGSSRDRAMMRHGLFTDICTANMVAHRIHATFEEGEGDGEPLHFRSLFITPPPDAEAMDP